MNSDAEGDVGRNRVMNKQYVLTHHTELALPAFQVQSLKINSINHDGSTGWSHQTHQQIDNAGFTSPRSSYQCYRSIFP